MPHGASLYELSALDRHLRSEIITFRATVATDTREIIQPVAVQLHDAYDYFITGISAAMTGSGGETASEDASADDIQELRFNLRSSDKDEDFFSSDIEMALLCNAWSGRPAATLQWYGHGYRIGAGVHLKCKFTNRAAITLARAVTAYVYCAMVPRKFHLAPPRF